MVNTINRKLKELQENCDKARAEEKEGEVNKELSVEKCQKRIRLLQKILDKWESKISRFNTIPQTPKVNSVQSNENQVLNGGSLFSTDTLKKRIDNGDEPVYTKIFKIPDEFLTEEQLKKLDIGNQKFQELREFINEVISDPKLTNEKPQEIEKYMINNLVYPLVYAYIPSFSIYFYKDCYFIRPPYHNINQAYKCLNKKTIGPVVAELLDLFKSKTQNIFQLYVNYVSQIGSLKKCIVLNVNVKI